MLGQELVARRKSLGLTQSELAQRLGVTVTTVSRWENNQRTIPLMARKMIEYIGKEGTMDTEVRSQIVQALAASGGFNEYWPGYSYRPKERIYGITLDAKQAGYAYAEIDDRDGSVISAYVHRAGHADEPVDLPNTRPSTRSKPVADHEMSPLMVDIGPEVVPVSPYPGRHGAQPGTYPHWDDLPWWHWAIGSPAGREALQRIGADVDPVNPWAYRPSGWRAQPWEDPGQGPGVCWREELRAARNALGEPDAGTFFAEICILEPRSVEYRRSHQTLIAISASGLRAAVMPLGWSL